MSRLDDLLDLIQTTNEVYFITAPGRVRTAFILVDDIIELALKTFLQEKALEQREQCIQAFEQAGWVSNNRQKNTLRRYFKEESDENEVCAALGRNPATNPSAINDFRNLITPFPLIHHWSANKPDARNTFDSVIDEVKPFFSPLPDGSPHPAIALLDDALHRHQTRNRFYHDHQQSGLTIDDEKCLRALCGMFDLMECLFPAWLAHVQANNTVRCQIGVLRLKRAAFGGQREVVEPYDNALEQLRRNHRYDIELRSVEHSLVHTVSDRFFRALREQFKNKIAELQSRIIRIDNMSRPRLKHVDERADKQRLVDILQQQLDEIQALLGAP
jgi:hypothetical protein